MNFCLIFCLWKYNTQKNSHIISAQHYEVLVRHAYVSSTQIEEWTVQPVPLEASSVLFSHYPLKIVRDSDEENATTRPK